LVASRQARVCDGLVVLFGPDVDAVCALVQQAQQPGRFDVCLGPDAELG